MANITKRGDSYRIKVSCGYDINGKQLIKSITWQPDPGMSPKQIEKELNRQAVLFEENCQLGLVLDGNIKFADFAEIWFRDYAEINLARRTVYRYKEMMKRINLAIGHIRIKKLQPHHLLSFYDNLRQEGIRQDITYKSLIDFAKILREKGLKKAHLAKLAEVSTTTIDSLLQGKNIAFKSAQKISKTIGIDFTKSFTPAKEAAPLSETTILQHHRLISSILSTAMEWQMIITNPCQRMRAPKLSYKEAKYLDEDETARLLTCLEEEPLKYRCAIYLDLGTGLRRGELCGLEWSDIDFENGILSIRRASLYLPGVGIYEDNPKTNSSRRSMKLPKSYLSYLKKYKIWQNQQKLALGDKWQNSNRIFTTETGGPIHPDSLSSWFASFAAKNGFNGITLHSLRHTNASLQIAAGIPLRTVSGRLGHAKTSTTSDIYAHVIRSADAAAADVLDDILTPKGQ